MPRAEPKRQIKVFIASPGDLAVERRAFRDAIDLLNLGFGDGAGVEFIPLGWEDTLAVVRSRSQAAINQDIDACDIFVLVMHRRWGQPAPDAEPYSSYTEEEFHRALARYRGSSSTPAMRPSSAEIAGLPSSHTTHSPTTGGSGAAPLSPASSSGATKSPTTGGAGAAPLSPASSSSATKSPTTGGAGVPPASSSSGDPPLRGLPSESTSVAPLDTTSTTSETSPSSGDTSESSSVVTNTPPHAPEIFVFFKHIDPASMADPGPQLEKVLKFRRQLEDQRIVLYRNFADEKEFAADLDRHLRAYVQGTLPKADAPLEKLMLPLDLLKQVEDERRAALIEIQDAQRAADKERDRAEAADQRNKALEARIDQITLQLSQVASQAAANGRIEEARQLFAIASQSTSNSYVLKLASSFYRGTSDTASDGQVRERLAHIVSPITRAKEYEKLGHKHEKANRLDDSEAMFAQAMEIFRTRGRLARYACQLDNLARIRSRKRDLRSAEVHHRGALAVYQMLGLACGMARTYQTIADAYLQQGEYQRAAVACWRAHALFIQHGRDDYIAGSYVKLGELFLKIGDRQSAETVLRKASRLYRQQHHIEYKQVETLLCQIHSR